MGEGEALEDIPGGQRLEEPLAYKVSVLAAFNADDIHAAVLENLDVGVNALASGLNAMLLECENVCDRDRMPLVCLLLSILLEKQQCCCDSFFTRWLL